MTRLTVLALLALGAASPIAHADDASTWARDSHSALRLIAGSRSSGTMLGGIELQLQPGWKTYWRTPGDSGVPPRFDFSGSENVDKVTVLWPAPMRFPDGAGGESLGYVKQLVLPLRIVAKSPDKPVTLRADINYAVCEKLCVPVEARATVTFDDVAGLQDRVLSAALDAIPKPAMIGDENPVSVRAVRRTADGKVDVDVAAPAGDAVDLFVEGPTADWALPLPRRIAGAPHGQQRFEFALEGLPPGAKPDGAKLKLTLVGTSRAYEVDATLP